MKGTPGAAALAGVSLLALAAGALPAAQAQPTGRAPTCFRSDELNGWHATPDAKTLYLRVGVNRIYRLDLSNRSQRLTRAARPDLEGARLAQLLQRGGFRPEHRRRPRLLAALHCQRHDRTLAGRGGGAAAGPETLTGDAWKAPVVRLQTRAF